MFEETLFHSVAEFSPPTAPATVIKAPHIYTYNRETGTQILEDFASTAGFKSMVFSPSADKLLPQSSPATIGRHLGSWLRSFHEWTSAPEQSTLRAHTFPDDPMRKLKCSITYDGFLGVLERFPELLEGHKGALKTIRDVMVKEFESIPTEEDENWGLIHGDMWLGKYVISHTSLITLSRLLQYLNNSILLPNTGWREPPPPDGANKIFIIDWEFAQFGHRAYDIGQIIGDLCERKVYNAIDFGLPVMRGVIEGYGALNDEMGFRVAIHVGVHLIGWYNRRPQKGPWVASPEAIKAGLSTGRDFILKGWEKDRDFFERGLLAPLFARK